MVPLGSSLVPVIGVDCTVLPGVLDVACVSGLCVVERCQPGYMLDPTDRSRCIPAVEGILWNVLEDTFAL